MWVTWVTAVFLALMAGLVSLIAGVRKETAAREDAMAQADQVQIAEGIERYIQLNGEAPPDISTLMDADGFQHLRAARNPWQRYERSATISDGVWQFQRAAAWTAIRPDGGATYRSENTCGTGDVGSAQAWCGSADGTWYRNETKERYNQEMSAQRIQMARTLQLFADHWTAKQAFPSTGNDGAVLSGGQHRALASLAGYQGAAGSCTGVHVWSGIPLDCGALFDVWGQPVKYQFQSPTLMVLSTETPFKAADGLPVVVATPLQAQE